MVRFLVRAIGYILLAGAFATLVIDGTRSIASSALVYTPLREALETALPGREEQLKTLVESRLGAEAWNSILQPVLGWPLAPVLLHFFNHQTHHRGQAHCILTGLGREAPSFDLVAFQRETGMGLA